MRSGDEQAGMVVLEYSLGPPLVVGIGVTIEEQDGGGFDAEPFELFAERGDFVVVERGVDFAVGQRSARSISGTCF
jgi:hypothetical protein